EKYGMEYYRPRYEETPDRELVDRHNREIAPLLKNRALFAESENFLLYDLWSDNGSVDEHVFAYSNRRGDQRALIVYNNHYGDSRGTIHRSAAYMDKGAGTLRQQSLDQALALPNDPDRYFAYRESASGLSFLRRASDLVQHGLYFELRAYQYAVLVDWRELQVDAEHSWDRLHDHLRGRGVEDLDGALLSLELAPVHDALRRVLSPGLVRKMAVLSEEMEAPNRLRPATRGAGRGARLPENEAEAEFLRCSVHFVEEARATYFARIAPPPALSPVVEEGAAEAERQATLVKSEAALLETRLRERLHAVLRIPQLEALFAAPWPCEARGVLPSRSPAQNAGSIWAPVLAWAVIAVLGESLDVEDGSAPALAAFDRFRLRHVLAEVFGALSFRGEDTWRAAARVRLALAEGVRRAGTPAAEDADSGDVETGLAESAIAGFAAQVWDEPDVRWLTGVHEAEGVTYFNKESFEALLWWHALPELAVLASQPVIAKPEVLALERTLLDGCSAAAKALYQLEMALGPEEVEAGAVTEDVGIGEAGAEAEPGLKSELAAEAPAPLVTDVVVVEPGAAVSELMATPSAKGTGRAGK
ncbi:MAG TPA: hypothetical protein VGD62_10715, partial [Acidobacteriaceae bacterium]